VNLLPRHANYLLLKIFFLAFLAGCVSLPRYEPMEGGFVLRGNLGVVQEDESFSARFYWRQNGPDFLIDLWGPLGQGRVALAGNERRLELREGDGKMITEGAPDAVMRQHLGWSLPLSVLPDWVQGRPAGGSPVVDPVYDEAGRLAAFSQLDWRVELERYQRVGSEGAEVEAGAEGITEGRAPGAFLPHRVTATRSSYRVRLAISAWQI
jgi:outer membrane lipoprotein LolB